MQNDVSQPVTVAEHIDVAADAVREGFHAVYNEPVDDDALVGEMYRAVGGASLLVDRLPELLRHLGRRCTELAGVDGLDTDSSTDVSGHETALAAAAAIEAVAFDVAANSAGRASPLGTAHSHLATLKINMQQ